MMKNKIALILAFAALLFPALAAAQTSIAVLDVQRLLSEAKAAQHIQSQMKAERETFLKQITEQEKLLRDKEKALLDEAPNLSKEDLAQKRDAFEKEFQQARDFAQKGKDRLDNAVNGATVELRDKVRVVVDAIAKEKGYDLVLARQHVIAGGDNLDISEEALKRLNETVSEIPLKFAE